MHTIVHHIAQESAKNAQGTRRKELLNDALAIALDKYEDSLEILEVLRGISRHVEGLVERGRLAQDFQKLISRKRTHSEFSES